MPSRPRPTRAPLSDLATNTLPSSSAAPPPNKSRMPPAAAPAGAGVKRKRERTRGDSTGSVEANFAKVDLKGKGRAPTGLGRTHDGGEDDDAAPKPGMATRRTSGTSTTATERASTGMPGRLSSLSARGSSSSRSASSSLSDDDDHSAPDYPDAPPTPAQLIDDTDDHFISYAPRAELMRCRKPELVRLWRVAGLLDSGEGEGLRKDELVDGLLEARLSNASSPSRGRTKASTLTARSGASSSSTSSRSSSSDSDRATQSDDSNPTPRRRQRLAGSPAAPRAALAPSVSEDGTPARPRRRTRTVSASGSSAAEAGEREDNGGKGKGRAKAVRVISTPVGRPRRRGVRERSISLDGVSGGDYRGEDDDFEETPRAAMGIPPKRRHSSNVASSSSLPAVHAAPALRPTRTHRRTTSTSSQSSATAASTDPFAPLTRAGSSGSAAGGGTRLTRRSSGASNASSSTSTRRTRAALAAATMTAVDPPPSGAAAGKRRPKRQAKAKALQALKGGEQSTDESSGASSSGSDGDQSDDGGEGGSSAEDVDGSAAFSDDGSADDNESAYEDGMHVDGSTPGLRHRARRTTRVHPNGIGAVEPLRLVPKRRGGAKAAQQQQPSPPAEEHVHAQVEDEGVPREAKRSGREAKRSGLRALKKEAEEAPATEVEENGSEDDDETAANMSVIEEEDDDEPQKAEVDEDESNEAEGIELENHTAATLARLRRDSLVRLCTTRELDVAGTKPQLAQALIDWRDSNVTSDDSAPSSSAPSSASFQSTVSRSTARPTSSAGTARTSTSTATAKTAGGRRKGSAKRLHANDPAFATQAKVTPTLLREDHVRQEQTHPSPTPPPSGHAHQAAAAEELNLDLESLGLEDKEIPAGQLVKMEKVGSGGFKDVYVGKLRGRLKVAIAEFRGQLGEMDIKELKLLADFKHPNIVKFLGVSIPEDRRVPIMMVSELCENGDLFDYIRNVPAPSKKVVIKLMLDISRGLQYLHLHKPAVIHRDCKSSNILITSRVVAKVGDFGLARVKHSTRSMIRSLVGTVCYQPPEMWTAHPKYDSKVDVFSCAMVFWEMLQWHKAEKKYPWEGQNEHAIYDLVGQKRLRPSVHKLHIQWGSDIVDLMQEMWVQEPKERPTMTAVVERLEAILKTC